VIVIVVLLNVARTCAIPSLLVRRILRRLAAAD
jgi:hypothetical protein